MGAMWKTMGIDEAPSDEAVYESHPLHCRCHCRFDGLVWGVCNPMRKFDQYSLKFYVCIDSAGWFLMISYVHFFISKLDEANLYILHLCCPPLVHVLQPPSLKPPKNQASASALRWLVREAMVWATATTGVPPESLPPVPEFVELEFARARRESGEHEEAMTTLTRCVHCSPDTLWWTGHL